MAADEAALHPTDSTPSKAYAATLACAAHDNVRPTPAGAFEAATAAFITGPRLDMGRLAARLGIASATLYRWTGSREKLIGEILAHVATIGWELAMADAAAADLTGVDRVVTVLRRFGDEIMAFDPLRRFLRDETPLAFRVLTMRGNIVQATAVRHIEELITTESQGGALSLRAPAAEVAFAITKICEGFLYSEPVANLDPDVDAALRIVRLLLA